MKSNRALFSYLQVLNNSLSEVRLVPKFSRDIIRKLGRRQLRALGLPGHARVGITPLQLWDRRAMPGWASRSASSVTAGPCQGGHHAPPALRRPGNAGWTSRSVSSVTAGPCQDGDDAPQALGPPGHAREDITLRQLYGRRAMSGWTSRSASSEAAGP